MKRYWWLLSFALLFVVEHAMAQAIPNAQACTAMHRFNQVPVPVRQRTGQSPFWAHARWDPDGWPSITYGPAYFRLPAIMQVFTSAHECGHLVLETQDEFDANCFALNNLSPTKQQESFIANFHRQLGPLPTQYGGSGVAFWAGTKQKC